MKFLPVDEQLPVIQRGVEEIIPPEDLQRKLETSRRSGTPLNVKLGCDPSRPDLHIGHAVVLRKLRHFQDLGHRAILVIGDFTAMIGDPSGRNKTRPQLTLEETRIHAQSYVEQAQVILDVNKLNIVYNSTWLSKMDFRDVIRLASHYTVARMLERDDFTKRYQSEIPISIHELLYPLAQGMDSVELKADVELGGTDQKFNLLVGRDLQREYDQEPQVIITTPLLEGTDGIEKMSKSYDNHIGLREDPAEMYGKTLSIPDTLIRKYYQLALDYNAEKLHTLDQQLQDPQVNPRDLKRNLARQLVTLYHSAAAAAEAEQRFDRIFIHKDHPEDIAVRTLGEERLLIDVILEAGLVSSKTEGKKLMQQGAIRLDGKPCRDPFHKLVPGQESVIKVGRRRFLRVR